MIAEIHVLSVHMNVQSLHSADDVFAVCPGDIGVSFLAADIAAGYVYLHHGAFLLYGVPRELGLYFCVE